LVRSSCGGTDVVQQELGFAHAARGKKREGADDTVCKLGNQMLGVMGVRVVKRVAVYAISLCSLDYMKLAIV